MLNTGSYTVILDECHFKDLLTQHVTPPPATVRQYPSINCMSVVNWWKKINSTFAFSRLIETHVRFWILQCIVINMSNKFCRCMYMYFDTIYYLFYRLVQNLHSLEWVSTNLSTEKWKIKNQMFSHHYDEPKGYHFDFHWFVVTRFSSSSAECRQGGETIHVYVVRIVWWLVVASLY